jgi:nucleoside 2-deoxyribosyltransferase
MSELVYLAGPITGCSYTGATHWRDQAQAYLKQFGIATLSPMRADTHTENLSSIDPRTDANDWQQGLLTPRQITHRDILDVQRCSLVLFDFRQAEDYSKNSCVEVGLAYAYQKPMVAVMHRDDLHRKVLMLNEMIPFIYEDMDVALRTVVQLLKKD